MDGDGGDLWLCHMQIPQKTPRADGECAAHVPSDLTSAVQAG